MYIYVYIYWSGNYRSIRIYNDKPHILEKRRKQTTVCILRGLFSTPLSASFSAVATPIATFWFGIFTRMIRIPRTGIQKILGSAAAESDRYLTNGQCKMKNGERFFPPHQNTQRQHRKGECRQAVCVRVLSLHGCSPKCLPVVFFSMFLSNRE